MTFGGWQSEVQEEFAVDIYKTIWDGCEVVENDTYGTEGENVAQLLDYGDVDKIIHIKSEQVFMAQRFRKPYWCKRDEEWKEPDMTLRCYRPCSDNPVEHDRMMNNVGKDRAMYPKRYAFGKVYNDHTRGIYHLKVLDTEEFIEGIKSGSIKERGPRENKEGQKFHWYKPKEIEDYGAVVHRWYERPSNPENILSWASD